MAEPLELRRRLTWRQVRLFLAQLLPVPIGMVLALGGIAQAVDSSGGTWLLRSLGLTLLGLGIAVWGARTAWQQRGILSRRVAARLDDEGVRLVTGTAVSPRLAIVSWNDVQAVAVLPSTTAARKVGILAVVVFVPRSVDLVRGDEPDHDLRARLAAVLGISAEQARTALGETRPDDRIPRILGWLAEHRPDVRVIDHRPTA